MESSCNMVVSFQRFLLIHQVPNIPVRFIILRYSGIVATLPSLFFTATQSSFCQVPVSASQAGAVLTVASSGAIFWFRVRALWNGSIVVSAIAGAFYLVMLGCWVSTSIANIQKMLTYYHGHRLLLPRNFERPQGHPHHSCQIASCILLRHGHRSVMLPRSRTIRVS